MPAPHAAQRLLAGTPWKSHHGRGQAPVPARLQFPSASTSHGDFGFALSRWKAEPQQPPAPQERAAPHSGFLPSLPSPTDCKTSSPLSTPFPVSSLLRGALATDRLPALFPLRLMDGWRALPGCDGSRVHADKLPKSGQTDSLQQDHPLPPAQPGMQTCQGLRRLRSGVSALTPRRQHPQTQRTRGPRQPPPETTRLAEQSRSRLAAPREAEPPSLCPPGLGARGQPRAGAPEGSGDGRCLPGSP